MDLMSASSLGKSRQSMGTKEICMLVLNDDHTCRNIVAEMLQHCSCEVLHIGKAMETLNSVWERNDRLDLVVTNIHRLDTNGMEIVQRIQKEFNLPTLLMSPDDKKIKSKGKGSSIAAYVTKSLGITDIKNLWQYALAREQGKNSAPEIIGSAQRAPRTDNAVEETAGHTTPVRELSPTTSYRKRKRKELQETRGTNEADRVASPVEKKPRAVWTNEMHRKFLDAIEKLGYDRAFPKKIVEVMNVPGLTRENVASHLQKYRTCLKRAQEGFAGSIYGITLANDVKEPCFPSGNSALNFNFSQGSSLHPKHLPLWTPFQQDLRRVNSMTQFNHSISTNTKASTGVSNLGHAQLLTANSRGNLEYPYIQTVSPFTAMTQKNNHMDIGNSRYANQSSLAQVESRLAPGVLVNQNFRVYGDQTKNMLLSIESGSSTRKVDFPTTFNSSGSFRGLRLAGDGKSITFGLTDVSCTDGTGGEFLLSSETNCSIPWNIPSAPSGGIYGKESSEYSFNNTPINSIHEQQLSLPLLGDSVDNNAIENLLLSVSSNPQQTSLETPSGTYGNGISTLYPSISAESLSEQPPSLPTVETWGNESSAQNPPTSSACITHQQPSLPPLETCGFESSAEDTSTCNDYIIDEQCPLPPLSPLLHDLDSFGGEANSMLLPATGSTSPQLFWDGEFDDAIFNLAD